MAARKDPGNQWTTKEWRDAVRVAVRRKHSQETTKLMALADQLVTRGLDGDVSALKEIGDRLDGKVPQALIGGGEDDAPLRMITEIRRVIVRPEHQDG